MTKQEATEATKALCKALGEWGMWIPKIYKYHDAPGYGFHAELGTLRVFGDTKNGWIAKVGRSFEWGLEDGYSSVSPKLAVIIAVRRFKKAFKTLPEAQKAINTWETRRRK